MKRHNFIDEFGPSYTCECCNAKVNAVCALCQEEVGEVVCEMCHFYMHEDAADTPEGKG